ncbi:UPF0164 family protein [candidate division KSB1 bacterium]|nr:UPF0164 family protein [candidate division KSB1 bacterium]
MRSILLLVTSTLWTSAVGFAQKGDAGQAGEFLRYGVGGRALGMGHVFTGLADDASTIYWNPGGLMNVQRAEFSSMYTNLFLDSRYTYLAVALPRSFMGPHNAVGLAWVNLNMADFDQRDANNERLGSFDFFEQALILSGARESVGSWGILNYGLNFKAVNQAFPGYISENGSSAQGWGFGVDIGATFRPINAPLLKVLPLRYLMPLQLGVAVQNLLPPKIGIGSGEKDKYPTVFRWGASYALLMGGSRVNVLYDQEIYAKRKIGHFFGAEALFPELFTGTLPSLRAGFSSRTSSPSFGGGIKLDYLQSAAIRIDFAYALKPHDALDSDFRLFLTIDFGKHFNAQYFADHIQPDGPDRQQMRYHLQALTRFIENNELARTSAWALADKFDRANRLHYLEFIKGLLLANALYEQLMDQVRSSTDPDVIQKLQSQAREVDAEYNRVISEIEKEQKQP